jgi:hypothetical protein
MIMTVATGPVDVETDGDVIDVLLAQHEQIRAGIAAVSRATPGTRDAAVRAVAAVIEAHEDVEARLVHPLAEQGLPDGVAMAHARVVEENLADELLSQLLTMGARHPRFAAVFGRFRHIMLEHLEHEENEEFTALRARFSPEHLIELGHNARENRLWL